MNLIIGRKPVLEAINSGEEIDQVFIQYGQQGSIIKAIQVAARKRKIKCSLVSPDKFKSLSRNSNTQGVAAKKLDQKFSNLDEVITASQKDKFPLILLLDSIQDTHNLGAILRTAECSGIKGVVVSKHNSAPINETVIKTSTGASEHLMITVANNLKNTISELKEKGFWIIGSSLELSSSTKPVSKVYTELDYKMPVALVLGNEEKGIKRIIAENCDFLVKIPMKGKIQSLNVSVAAGILLFEILRQRNS